MNLNQTDLKMSMRPTIYRDKLHDPLISKLWSTTRRLDQSIQDLNEDERVSEMLRAIRRIRWRLTSIPLPSSHMQIDLAGQLASLTEKAHLVTKLIGEDTAAELKLVVNVLKEIESNATSSLFDQVLENLVECNDATATIVIQDRSFIASCVAAFAGAGAPASAPIFATVMRPEDLRDAKVGTTQIIVGVSSALPDWIFTSPSADIITLVHFDIVRDREKVCGLLDNTFTVEIIGSGESAIAPPEFVLDEFVRPERNWASVRESISSEAFKNDDLVPTRAFVVADNNFVLLNCDSDETCRMVWIDGNRVKLKRSLVRDVIEGDYLVIRTDGGRSDFIAQMADEILGERAESLRELQSSWTSRLRDLDRTKGRHQTQLDLKIRGCKAQNMGQWVRGNTIRPRSEIDFKVVLQLCGINDSEIPRYLEGMTEIRSAHNKAGNVVARQLEDSIAELDAVELALTGWKELRIKDRDVRPMGLFRVEEAESATGMSRLKDVGILTSARVK